VTRSPAYSLMPRRLACESLPFLELPPPFFLAIILHPLNAEPNKNMSDFYFFNPYLSVWLSMPVTLPVIFLSLVLEYQNLSGFALRDHFGCYARSGQNRISHLNVFSVVCQ